MIMIYRNPSPLDAYLNYSRRGKYRRSRGNVQSVRLRRLEHNLYRTAVRAYERPAMSNSLTKWKRLWGMKCTCLRFVRVSPKLTTEPLYLALTTAVLRGKVGNERTAIRLSNAIRIVFGISSSFGNVMMAQAPHTYIYTRIGMNNSARQ